MTSSGPPKCTVVGGEKLPSAAGSAEMLCASVESAVASLVPDARYSAKITVVSKSMLATALQVNGRALPERRFAVTDRDLNAASVKKFAERIAAEVAKVLKP